MRIELYLAGVMSLFIHLGLVYLSPNGRNVAGTQAASELEITIVLPSAEQGGDFSKYAFPPPKAPSPAPLSQPQPDPEPRIAQRPHPRPPESKSVTTLRKGVPQPPPKPPEATRGKDLRPSGEISDATDPTSEPETGMTASKPPGREETEPDARAPVRPKQPPSSSDAAANQTEQASDKGGLHQAADPVQAKKGKVETADQGLPLEKAIPNYERNPQPRYPSAARRRGYEGTVLLLVNVGENGAVREVKVVESSGYRVLDRAAQKAVRDWQFQPGRRGDREIATDVQVPITFRLR